MNLCNFLCVLSGSMTASCNKALCFDTIIASQADTCASLNVIKLCDVDNTAIVIHKVIIIYKGKYKWSMQVFFMYILGNRYYILLLIFKRLWLLLQMWSMWSDHVIVSLKIIPRRLWHSTYLLLALFNHAWYDYILVFYYSHH